MPVSAAESGIHRHSRSDLATRSRCFPNRTTHSWRHRGHQV